MRVVPNPEPLLRSADGGAPARPGGAAGASPVPLTGSGGGPVRRARPPRLRIVGWYATFLTLAVGAILAVNHFTGVDVLAASGRFLWNALAAVANSATRAAGGLLAMLAKGVGWRRLARLSKVIMGVGLSYAGGVILSQGGLQRARGWRGKVRLLLATMRRTWVDLPLPWKLAIVGALIVSQLYLHVVLIVFPIAFLVPVVRRTWVQAADLVFGSWYWRTFGRLHRTIVAGLRGLPVMRQLIGAIRLARIRYLTAWRLWRYDPRYGGPVAGKRRVDLIEPVRLWWRHELDIYLDCPLLSGRRRA